MSSPWRPLGAQPPTELTEARLQLHYAAQVVSGVGRTLLAPLDDDSHTNLGWNRKLGALTSRTAPGVKPFSAGLEFAGLRLLLLDDDEAVLAAASLGGMTPAEAYEWLGDGIAARRGEPLDGGFTPLHYDMPPHPLADGARFELEDSSAFAELANWFHNADLLLTGVHDDVRCWPHHFDIATLLTLADGKQIGIGLSPGDESYDEPYFYCSPYPQPSPDALPPFEGPGHWHTAGFISAVLTGTELLKAEKREAAAAQYVEAALGLNRKILGLE